MKRPRYPVLLSAIVFAAAYAIAWEASSWFSAYVLDWWDVKFGDRMGNVAFQRQLLLIVIGPAVLLHTAAAFGHRRWYAGASSRAVMLVAGVAAFVAQFGWLTFAAATRGVDWRTGWGEAARVASLALLVGGPPAASAALVALVRWRGACVNEPAV